MAKNRPNDGSASIPIDRAFVRSGLFAQLTNAESNTLLQVIWNGPVRPRTIIGISQDSLKRCLRRLRALGLIERTTTGYVCVRDFSGEKNWIWLEALRYGWLSLPARLLLIFLSEWCDGLDHCYHGSMAKAMHGILGIKRRRYDALFSELSQAGMVVKTYGGLFSIAYDSLEARAAHRGRHDYLRSRGDQRRKRLTRVRVPGSGSACAGGHQLRSEGSGSASEGVKECVQGLPSGLPLRDYSRAHSPPEESGQGSLVVQAESSLGAGVPSKATAPKVASEPPATTSSREETFLAVFMSSKGLSHKFTTGVVNYARTHGLKDTLDGLSPSQWVLCLYFLRRNTTVSFKLFFEGREQDDLARKARKWTEKDSGSDPQYGLERLLEAIQENPDAIGTSDAKAVVEDFKFQISRPIPYHVEEWVKGAMLHPREPLRCYETKREFALAVQTWKPRSLAEIREYGRKYAYQELVEGLIAKYEPIVTALKYQETIRAQLEQRAAIERRNEEIARQRMAESEAEDARRIAALEAEMSGPPSRILSPQGIRQMLAAMREKEAAEAKQRWGGIHRANE